MKRSLALFYCLSLSAYQITVAPQTLHDFAKLKNKIISNPDAIVTTTYANKDRAKKELPKGVSHFNAWVQSQEAKCALAMVTECAASGCQLSRLKYKHKRTEFEKYSSEKLAKTVSPRGVNNYVSFASGRCFLDTRILTLAHQKGLRAITLHLIDPEYAPVITNLSSKNTHDILQTLSDSSACRYAHTLKEFLIYVQNLFGAQNVQVHIYGSGQEYLNTVQANGMYTPDFISSADFDPKVAAVCTADFIGIVDQTKTAAVHLQVNGIHHLVHKANPQAISLPADTNHNRFNNANIIGYYKRF